MLVDSGATKMALTFSNPEYRLTKYLQDNGNHKNF